MSPKLNRVVVTGMGAVTPLGVTKSEIVNALKKGISGVTNITRFDTSALAVKFAAEAKFAPEDFLDAKEVRRNDRFIQMCLAATDLAVKESGLIENQLTDAGVVFGVGLGGLYSIEENTLELKASGPRRISPFFVPSILANLASGNVSIRYKTHGPNFAISSACASGSQAIGYGFREIQSGRRDLWIVGGAEAPITPLSIAGFCASRALSRKNESPLEASRPFDEARDGFVLGEGAATLILESYQSAKKRGAKILGEIIGFGMASDGYHVAEPEPNGEGAFRAMQEALRDAETNAPAIDYVNAHATSTPLGDQIESLAIQRIFNQRSSEIFVSSTKSLTGHACGAAGALESVFCLYMLDEKFLPPAVNLKTPSDNFKFKSPGQTELTFAPKLIMNNSFGFGGINTCLVFARGE